MKRHARYGKSGSFNRPFTVRRAEKKARNRVILTIIIVIIIAYSFFSWILPTLIGSLSVLNRFKSSPTPETPVSEKATLAPPVLNIPYEATNTARIRIQGYATPEATVEIYLDDEKQTIAKTKEDGSFITDDISLNLGTNNISGKTVDDKGTQSLSSKPIRIIFSNEKPTLNVSTPEDNMKITGGDKKVTVYGTTDAQKNIVVTANNTRLIVGQDGTFSQTLDINEGENTIIINATDTAGNSTQITRKVTYQP